ncbi:MAG: EAL domain-containing protein [Anaerotardibacter sp.]
MKRQILIVEDNDINREILFDILSEDYRVLQAENGQVGLDILREHAGDVDLILLDNDMPVLDGFGFLRGISKDPDLSLIPVIVATSNDSETDEISALTHGATDFVPKPYRPQIIMQRVANLIKFRETAAIANQLQHDRLTGLLSKEFFYQKVREELNEHPETEYNIVCANVENFKLYNDVFGTKDGDRLLKEIANIMKTIIGDDGFCTRFTADRFLSFQRRDKENIDRANFGEQHPDITQSDHLKNTVMRWGIYEITDLSVPVEQMCDRAMLAVNSIKGKYDQFFAVYDDSLRKKLIREKTIYDAMEKALFDQEFFILLQPKYSVREGEMIGAEALVRWKHSEWGTISPGEFIPLFEKNGFIFQMDAYVWECACKQIQAWQKRNMPVVPISVNVSRTDVFHPRLTETLIKLTQKYEINPALLHLEITEMSYGESPERLISAVKKLREYGFVIEMDDFCSGYSSLNMLSLMDLDIVKLDLDFVQSETAKKASQSILEDVIRAAHRKQLSVVAEGVETKEQMSRLKSSGCDYVQGFFLAAPMPVEEFEKLLLTQAASKTVDTIPSFRNVLRKQQILIIEEESEFRDSLCHSFEEQYQVISVASIEEALLVVNSETGLLLSAVILSMTAPEQDPNMVISALRSDPRKWHIPVLATIPQCNVTQELPLTIEADDFLCKCHPIADLHKRINRLISDTICRENECALRTEANHDYLTGLLNRRGLQEKVASLRKEDFPTTVYLFDLDNLKLVNDTQGHNTGDKMIKTFADLLVSSTRDNDILCRYGGDEFLVLLKRMGDEEIAFNKCSTICKKFSSLFTIEGKETSCSAGITFIWREDVSFELIIEQADQALYCAKRENKGNCKIWERTI